MAKKELVEGVLLLGSGLALPVLGLFEPGATPIVLAGVGGASFGAGAYELKKWKRERGLKKVI